MNIQVHIREWEWGQGWRILLFFPCSLSTSIYVISSSLCLEWRTWMLLIDGKANTHTTTTVVAPLKPTATCRVNVWTSCHHWPLPSTHPSYTHPHTPLSLVPADPYSVVVHLPTIIHTHQCFQWFRDISVQENGNPVWWLGDHLGSDWSILWGRIKGPKCGLEGKEWKAISIHFNFNKRLCPQQKLLRNLIDTRMYISQNISSSFICQNIIEFKKLSFTHYQKAGSS